MEIIRMKNIVIRIGIDDLLEKSDQNYYRKELLKEIGM